MGPRGRTHPPAMRRRRLAGPRPLTTPPVTALLAGPRPSPLRLRAHSLESPVRRSGRRPMAQADIREYTAQARSTETFGRVLCNARDQHFVVDGPVQNGCPGEAITPAEVFLAGVAACGVELVQVLAKQSEIPLQAVRVAIEG